MGPLLADFASAVCVMFRCLGLFTMAFLFLDFLTPFAWHVSALGKLFTFRFRAGKAL